MLDAQLKNLKMLSSRRLSFTLSFVFNDIVSPEKYSIQKLLKKMLHKCYEIVNYLYSKKRSTILKKNRNLRRYSSYLVNACGWNVIQRSETRRDVNGSKCLSLLARRSLECCVDAFEYTRPVSRVFKAVWQRIRPPLSSFVTPPI